MITELAGIKIAALLVCCAVAAIGLLLWRNDSLGRELEEAKGIAVALKEKNEESRRIAASWKEAYEQSVRSARAGLEATKACLEREAHKEKAARERTKILQEPAMAGPADVPASCPVGGAAGGGKNAGDRLREKAARRLNRAF